MIAESVVSSTKKVDFIGPYMSQSNFRSKARAAVEIMAPKYGRKNRLSGCRALFKHGLWSEAICSCVYTQEDTSALDVEKNIYGTCLEY